MSHTTLRTVPPQAKTQALAPALPRPRSGRAHLVRPTGSVLYLPEKLRMKLTHFGIKDKSQNPASRRVRRERRGNLKPLNRCSTFAILSDLCGLERKNERA